jgi:hypothetical protein
MNVYDIEIDGINLSSKTYSILAEDFSEANKIAESMVAPWNEEYEEAKIIRVELNCYLTVPEDYVKETKEELDRDSKKFK